MSEDKNIATDLWNYIDGNLSDKELLRVKNLLQEDEAWNSHYKRLLQLDILMKDELSMEEPSMRFTKNIMEQIKDLPVAPATKNYINAKIIFSIAFFFMLLIAGLLIYSFAQVNWSAPSSSSSSFIELFKPDPRKYFTPQAMHVFLMIDVVLGLMFLDRFLNRKKALKQQHT
ncbi:MAG: hypothetical protein JWP81_1167 [Ferruginibacter sp.]|nr:hypothetical protein [Ferruginibacter sp.]